MDYQGFINGIDVIATAGKSVRCLAFVNKVRGGAEYIQVETEEHRLQTALELACSEHTKVEVSYAEKGGLKVLSRVRLLDR